MILYSAVGGGLGHLTRARRVLEQLNLAQQASILTASPYATDRRITGSIPIITLPNELDGDVARHREWLRTLISERGIERLITDTFPGGIQGELCTPHGAMDLRFGLPMDLVARGLKWTEYRQAVPDPLPHFETTWRVEELTSDYEAFVQAHSDVVRTLQLSVPRRESDSAGDASESYGTNFWLIVHSGPVEEVRELVQYAAELRDLTRKPPTRVLVASRCDLVLPANFEAVDEFPARRLFAGASRIISAAGFNIMLETEAWHDKHTVVPFPRRFDDQFLRAARRRS